MPTGASWRAWPSTSVVASCVFEPGPYAREGSDVVVVERIDEVLLDRLLEAPLGRFREVSSALGEADERHPSVALVGAALEMPGADGVLDQPRCSRWAHANQLAGQGSDRLRLGLQEPAAGGAQDESVD